MKLIIGLGNPGKTYAKTRHNIGFMVLDKLRKELSANEQRENDKPKWELSDKFNAEICKIKGIKPFVTPSLGRNAHTCAFRSSLGVIKKNGADILLAKPMTYMNASGDAVGIIARYYKLRAEDIIVTHDDKDLPLGTVRVHIDRGDAGHNGVASIIARLGSKNFTRVRVGIAGKDKKTKPDTATFVLKKFGLLERRSADTAIELAVKEIIKLI